MNDDNGKYRLLLKLGRGGMAEVHVAVARGPAGFNKLVVVKRLLPGMAEDEAFREMFMQEARLAARINHPNIVQTYEVGDHGEGMFLAMEYLEGQPLSRLVRTLQASDKKLAVSTCVRIACDVLAGLHHAHELKDFDGTALKVIHRDISPQNVFVTYVGQVKVLDFGIAKAERSSTKTQPGWLKGKYAYMAPEQFLNGEIDRRVDVFTTTTVLWELITGKQLFGGGTEAQTVKRLVTEPIPRLATELPSIDPQLDAIVARGLEREPKDRFSTALEMREALEEVLARLGSTEHLGKVASEAFKETRAETEQQISRLLGDSARLSAVGIGELPSVGSLRAMTANGPEPGASGMSHAGVAHTTATPIPPDPGADDESLRSLARGRLGVTGIFAAGAALVLATIVIARTVSGPPAGRAPEPTSVAAAAAPPAPREASIDPGAHATAIVDPAASAAAGKTSATASATHHAAVSAAPKWTPPPPPPAKTAAPAPTTTAAAPTSAAANESKGSPPVPATHDDQGGTTRRPAPTTTAPEGRRFRTTL